MSTVAPATQGSVARTNAKGRSRPSRKDLGPDDSLCSYCPAKCCRYLALAIDTPTTRKDFDYVRWYLLHDRATVFIEDDAWYLLVYTPCKHLRQDNLCGIYETRPQICRDYSTRQCEYEDDWVYDHYLETPEQVEEYVEAVLGPRKGQSIRSPKPQPPKIIPTQDAGIAADCACGSRHQRRRRLPARPASGSSGSAGPLSTTDRHSGGCQAESEP